MLLAALAVVAGCRPKPPSINQVGGVVLVYQLEDANAAPKEEQEATLKQLATVLDRRLDPDGRRGVTVEPLGATRVRISLPGAAPAISWPDGI